MGIFNDLKKVLFGAKSVAKSSADKTTEAGEELWDKTKDTVEDIGEKVLDTTGEMLDKTKNIAEDIGETIIEKSSDIVEHFKDTATDIGSKILDTTENIGEKIRHPKSSSPDSSVEPTTEISADDLFEDEFVPSSSTNEEQKIQDTQQTSSEPSPLEKKVTAIKDEIVEQAENLAEKAKEKLDDINQKAEELREQIAQEEAERKENPPIGYENASKSLLDDKDDFFAKAKRFADGDYQGVKDSDKPEIVKMPDEKDKKEDNVGKVYGFEDRDGDGNEIVDDAIVIDEDKDKNTE